MLPYSATRVYIVDVDEREGARDRRGSRDR